MVSFKKDREDNGYVPTGEEKLTRDKVRARYKEARENWIALNRERFDQYYKNFRDYGEDRLQQLKKMGGDDWMSNLFVPITASHIRTMHPLVIEARPEMRVLGRNQEDHDRAENVQAVLEYLWEKAGMDRQIRGIVWQALTYGTAWGKVIWRVKARAKFKADEQKSDESPEFEDKTIYYDDPAMEMCDVYDVFPDPYATSVDSMRYICQRYVMTKEEILKTWGDPKKGSDGGLKNFEKVVPGGDVNDYKSIRRTVPQSKFSNKRGTSRNAGTTAGNGQQGQASTKNLVEVVEYWEDDRLVVMANDVVIIDKPNPYPSKEIPFVRLVYEELPFEIYGVGIAEQVEQVQYAINTIRNQRVDNVTLSIHKMFIVNPLALVDQADLTARPFGMIRTPDPQAVRPVEFGDIKQSAFMEDDAMMATAKSATGVDDFSRGVGGAASLTATAVTAQKESTSDRVKNFVRILETDVYAKVMRLWLEYIREFYPYKKIEEIVDGEKQSAEVLNVGIRVENNGKVSFPLIRKEDLMGEYDFRVASNSTIAGTQDLKLRKLNELMDRAVQAGSNPATGETIVDLRALWRKVVQAYGFSPSDILASPSAPQQPQGPQIPSGVQNKQLAAQMLGIDINSMGPEQALDRGGSGQARPGQMQRPPQLPELRDTLPINTGERNGPMTELGVDLSNNFQ